MADHIGDDINQDGSPLVPDVPQTALAFRTWRLDESGKLLSINAPNLTGKAGGNAANQGGRKIGYIHRKLADPEGQHGWPIASPLMAECGVRGAAAETMEDHGRIPSKGCSCGIYATTEIKVINSYLGNETYLGVAIRGPVLGIVELGGTVIPATQGYRARYARIAVILAIDEVFSLAHPRLAQIAEFYQVPLIRPFSINPEDYREAIGDMPLIADPSSIGDELEEWLKENSGDGADKDEDEKDDKEGGE